MTVSNTQSAHPTSLYNVLSPFDIRHISRKHIRGFRCDLYKCWNMRCDVCLLVTDTENISLQTDHFCLMLLIYKVCISIYVYAFVIVHKQTKDLETGIPFYCSICLFFHLFQAALHSYSILLCQNSGYGKRTTERRTE